MSAAPAGVPVRTGRGPQAATGEPTAVRWLLIGLAVVAMFPEKSPFRGARLERHVRSFFQGNRYLLEPFVDWVMAQVEAGPLVDLYAGVGLFSLAAAAKGIADITAVEGDRFAARHLGCATCAVGVA